MLAETGDGLGKKGRIDRFWNDLPITQVRRQLLVGVAAEEREGHTFGFQMFRQRQARFLPKLNIEKRARSIS